MVAWGGRECQAKMDFTRCHGFSGRRKTFFSTVQKRKTDVK
jgi:hypothetical protein